MTAPRISVVVPTHDRPGRLAMLLAALRAQTLPSSEFEVMVVDDGSGAPTEALLTRAAEIGDLRLRAFRHDSARGPGAARNTGWRAAGGPVIAFTDDDCRPAPDWLERGLEATAEHPDAVIQGRVEQDPEQMDALNPFAHWVEVHDAHQGFPTANILYPRDLLERLDGFDETFKRAGEDTDLGWRAIEAGAEVVFAPDVLVHHGVVPVGALTRFRLTKRWTETVRLYRRHPGMPKVKGLFWRYNHWELFRFLLALVLPRRLGPVRLFLAAPYVKHLTDRRTGPLLAPYLLALDLAEVLAIVRGAIRYRVFVL